MLKTLQDQHVLVLGLGISGLAMARWCAARGARVTVADTREAPPQLHALREACPEARFVAGPFAAALIEGSDVRAVFRSPGLAPAAVAPVMDAARAIGLWTGSELDLFARALADLQRAYGYQPRVLAVTGTNGKTTVTALTGQLVERAGRRVAVAGNIGPSLLDTLALELERLPEGLPENLPTPHGEAERDDVDAVPDAAHAAGPAGVDEALKTVAETDDEALEADGHVDSEDDGNESRAQALEEGDDEEGEPDGDEPRVAAGSAPEPEPEPEPEPTASDFLPQVWVLELSSFQLDGVQGFEPAAATVLNITQDHLDWHGDMAAYAAAKQRVFGSRGVLLLNRDDPAVMAMWPAAPAKAARGDKARAAAAPAREVVTFGADMPRRPGDWGIEDAAGMVWLVRALEADETRKPRRRGSPSAGMTGPGFDDDEELHIQRLMPADALRIRGRHNAANALAALALASAAGCPLAPMLYGLREYRGEPHRVEPVAIVNGVEYFDDSKGTNVGATVAALQGLGAERRVVAILGGEGKGQDFAPLAEPVRRFARAVVLIGRDAPLIRAALEATGVALFDGTDMADAVRRATERAHAGDAVLLSPACASFDMFDNYAHRGAVFREAVAELARDAGEIAA